MTHTLHCLTCVINIPDAFNLSIGLLIKQMIKLAEQDPTYKHIYNNTSGLLMYSVPHRGLPIVSRSSQAHYLFFPSTEVQELSQGMWLL